MKTRKLTLAGLVVVTASGCAFTYEDPSIPDKNYSTTHSLKQADVLTKARNVLLLEGFQIASSDDAAGFVSTAFKNWRLKPQYANCGSTLGIDYLKDNRTKTEVSVNVLVDSKRLTIRSNIHGEYKPGAIDQDITLSCVSKGVLEKELAKKILG